MSFDHRHAVAESDAILADLTTRQHLRPLATVRDVLQQTTDALDCCPQAVARAMAWLGIDANASVGRLRRSQLVQLARAIHRFWSHAATASSGSSR